MSEYMGIEYLRKKLNNKRIRINLKYKYYDMKFLVRDLGISTPPELRNLNSVVGWNAKAVDSIADRLVFNGFTNDIMNFSQIFQMNNQDVLIDSANLGALITSCDFIYISEDEAGFPRLQVIDGGDATGIIDPITNMLKEGYAVLERDKYNKVVTEAYFIPGMTYIIQDGDEAEYPNMAPWPLLVPWINKPSASRPFGRSIVSRACMNLTQSACRTLKRSEIAAEFFSFPQKYAIGISDELEDKIDRYQAAMSYLFTITKDEDGNTPTIGQFTQQSMQPHTDQFKMFASAFGGETGLTLDDLGFPTENPSSAEAIKAAHENLRLKARKAQRNFTTALINTGYLAACVRDKMMYQRQVIYQTGTSWEPIFEPDASMLGAIGDGIGKLNSALPGYIDERKMKEITGI